jgi:hypothetical protein
MEAAAVAAAEPRAGPAGDHDGQGAVLADGSGGPPGGEAAGGGPGPRRQGHGETALRHAGASLAVLLMSGMAVRRLMGRGRDGGGAA